MPLRLDQLPYATDGGHGARARIGLLALASDATIEHDFRAVLGPLTDVELYTTRCAGNATASPVEALELAEQIVPATHDLLPGHRLDVIALACGTAALLLGSDGVEAQVRRARPDVHVTTQVTAVNAALRACGIGKIGVLTPYHADFNLQIEQALASSGIEVAVFGSFDEDRDAVICAITEDAIRHNVLALAETAKMDGFLISGTGLRSLPVIAGLERELGIPVIGAGHALIWHSLRLAGITDVLRSHGLLFGLPM